ncbi:hypothetical protein CRENPOLYSF2_400006 [Crenothrix polyspora]|uniref:Uncharacterized protein n=1 Tax=Crenothrix polyspora TaxID=360316 RepID=A0A1R4HE20_9GAMM|nr:hypothetical protein CRENPOLYSF2_400006 [Crenothrix polyspora]
MLDLPALNLNGTRFDGISNNGYQLKTGQSKYPLAKLRALCCELLKAARVSPTGQDS